MTPLRPLAFAAALLTPEQVPSVPQPEGPVMTFPAHTRAVLNAPGQTWKAGYAGEEPPAYVAVIPLDTLKTHYPARPDLAAEVGRTVAMAQGAPIVRGGDGLSLPFIPTLNMAQMATGSVARISNSDIQGFRYLDVHSPDWGARVPRTAVRYVFYGVTRDGKYLVAMRALHEIRSLPTAEQIGREDARNGGYVAPFPGAPGGLSQAAFQKATERYLAALTTRLDAEGRVGRLAPLDAVVRSIRVGQ